MHYLENISDGYETSFENFSFEIDSHILVLSGASGAGKTTMSNYILNKNHNFGILQNVTTRECRNQEDKLYNMFVSKKKFEQGIANNEFFYHACWSANKQYYGLKIADLQKVQSSLIYNTTYTGYLLKSQNPTKVINIWLNCNDPLVLKKRLQTKKNASTRWHRSLYDQQRVFINKNQFLKNKKVDAFVDTSQASIQNVYDQIKIIAQEFQLFLT